MTTRKKKLALYIKELEQDRIYAETTIDFYRHSEDNDIAFFALKHWEKKLGYIVRVINTLKLINQKESK